jgi:hypothetical protein
MDCDTVLPRPGDLVGGNIAEDEASFLSCSCQLSCIQSKVLQAQLRHNGYSHARHASTRHVVSTAEARVIVCQGIGVGVGGGHAGRKR